MCASIHFEWAFIFCPTLDLHVQCEVWSMASQATPMVVLVPSAETSVLVGTQCTSEPDPPSLHSVPATTHSSEQSSSCDQFPGVPHPGLPNKAEVGLSLGFPTEDICLPRSTPLSCSQMAAVAPFLPPLSFSPASLVSEPLIGTDLCQSTTALEQLSPKMQSAAPSVGLFRRVSEGQGLLSGLAIC